MTSLENTETQRSGEHDPTALGVHFSKAPRRAHSFSLHEDKVIQERLVVLHQGEFCPLSGDIWLWRYFGFLGGSVVKNLPGNAGDVGSVSGSGRSPGEGGDHALQHSWTEETGGL